MANILEYVTVIFAFAYEVIRGYIMCVIERFIKKPKSIDGKIVVITGGASGIGKEVAQMFANIGAKIALLDVNEIPNQKAANEINENAGLAVPFTVDVTNPSQMREVAVRIQQHRSLGDPDLIICNAGVLIAKSLLELSDDDIRRTMDVNLLGYFWTVRAFLPRMLENNRGHIAAISSVGGYFGNTHGSVYSASKFGVRGLMESLEWEIYDSGKNNVKVTTVYPFFTRTPLVSLLNIQSRCLPLLTVEETASVIVDAILYEKVEAYTSTLASILCNALKATCPQQCKVGVRQLLNIRYK